MPQQGQMPWEQNWAKPDEAPVDITGMAKKYGLDPNIIHRQIQQESGGDQSAVSPKGAIGTMQLMPETAKRLGVDPYNKQQNIEGGMQEMSRLVKKYNGDYTKALAAYNAGEDKVDKAGGIPNISETQNYVKGILGDTPQVPANPWERNWATPQTATTPQAQQSPTFNKGDVRPSEPDIKKQRNLEATNREISNFYGRMIPDSAMPYLQAANKYLVEPFDKMAQVGATVGSDAMRIAGMHAGITGPKGQGVMAGLGELAGGTVADPRMWPFLLEGAAESAVSKLAARGFSMQMLYHAATQIPEVKKYMEAGDDYNAARTITDAVASGYLGATGALAKTPEELAVEQAKIKSGTQKTPATPSSAHTQEVVQKPITSTPQGPISTANGQQLQLDFVSKAPVEAHAPQTKSATSAEPALYKDQPLPGLEPGKFPGRLRGNVGAPDIKFEPGPKVEAQPPAIPVSTDKMGVKWAKEGDVQVSVPKSVPEEKVQDYARQKLDEQKAMQAPIKAKVPVEAPPKVGDVTTRLGQEFAQISDWRRKADIAESDDHASTLNSSADRAEEESRSNLSRRLGLMESGDVRKLSENAEAQADKLDAQAKAIRDLTESTIKNRGIKKEIADLRSTGGPVRRVVDPETGERMTIKPQAEVARGGRSVLDELQGRVPTSDFEALKIAGKPEGVTDQEWASHVDKLQAERLKLKKAISDAVTIASDTGSSLEDAGINEHIDRLKEIEDLLGKYSEPATTGRRPNVKPQLDENGAIKAPEALKSWTFDRAKLAIDKNLRQMPSDEEFFQHADMLDERSRLYRQAANAAKAELGKRAQKGFVGESLPKEVREAQRLSSMVPNQERILAQARRLGMDVHPISEDSSPHPKMLISPDGKWGINLEKFTSHSDVTDKLLPQVRMQGDTLRAMTNKGWIRKQYYDMYEAWNLPDDTRSAIEHSILMDRMTNRPIQLDTLSPRGNLVSLDINPGWEDLSKAIDEAKSKHPQFNREAGRVSGVASLTGATAGMLAGGAIAGPHGAAIGFVVGFTTPAILESKPFTRSLRFMDTVLKGHGLDLHEWINGKPQLDLTGVGSGRMKMLMQEQEMHSNKDTRWIDRAKALPPRIYRGFDRYAYVADQKNMSWLGRHMMSFDKDGKVFRDLNLPDTQSLYLALYDAHGRANGQRWYQAMQYVDILKDANKQGLKSALTQALNYKAYERGFQVLNEHVSDLQQKMQEAQKQLANPSITVRETASIQDRLRDLEKYSKDIQERVQDGRAAPGGFNPQSLQEDQHAFYEKLGPENEAKLRQLMNRTFESRAHILDMLHSNGIIGDEAYQTYKARGNEYVPLDRIMDDLADKDKEKSGTNPLYLRHQTVIRELEGSSRTNLNPWEAFSNADARAFNQIMRNDTMRHAVDLAKAYPSTIGQEFKKVDADYQLKKGEADLFQYVDGKPVRYAVPEYLGKTFETYPGAAKTALGVYANWWGHQWKRGATVYNLSFQAASLFGHAASGLALSKSNSEHIGRFVGSWLKSVKSVLTKDQVFREMVRSGAAFGGFQQVLDPEHFATPTELGKLAGFSRVTVLDKMENMAAVLENINRTTTFRNARLDGHSERAAGIEAKRYSGAPDFSRGGDISQSLNHFLMFLNAHVQYGKQFGDILRKDPKRIGGIMIASTVAALALANWNNQQKDSNGVPMLRKVSPYERERNWVVLLPWNHMVNGVERPMQVNIPKPYWAQTLNPIEEAANRVVGAEVRTGTQQALDSMASLSPVPMHIQEGRVASSLATSVASAAHPVAKTFIQQYSNTNDFGMPIVPESQQKLFPSRQFNANTSPAIVTAGQGGPRGVVAGGVLGGVTGGVFAGLPGAVIGGLTGAVGMGIPKHGVSPERIEAGMRSMFASGATQTESYFNPFFDSANQTKGKDPMSVARSAPFIGPTVNRFLGGQGDAEVTELSKQFYPAAEQAQMAMNTAKDIARRNPEQLEKFMYDNKKDLEKATLATHLQEKLGRLGNLERFTQSRTDMSDDDKNKLLQQIREGKIYLLKNGMDALRGSPQVGQAAAFPGQGQGAPR